MSELNLAAALRYLLRIDYMETRAITKLKSKFEREIASNRTVGLIHNIGDLVKVLKKRDLITINNLDTIAAELPRSIYQEYDDIIHRRVVEQIAQVEAPRVVQNNVQGMPDDVRERRPVRSPEVYSSHKRNLETIYMIICDEMGPNHWKTMARKLGIKEEVIDSFSLEHRTPECVRKVLHIHETNSHPDFWRQYLLHAIDEAKRVDVRKKVEQKLDEYNITYP